MVIQMRKRKKSGRGRMHAICGITAILLGMTGCTGQEGKNQIQQEPLATMEPEPVLSYEVPETEVNILVSQVGYRKMGTKTAVFLGEEIPREFYVVDAVTGKTVFQGNPGSSVYHSAVGEYVSYGDFTSFQEEGSYYIQCSQLGRSYSFAVKDDVYREMMDRSLGKLKEDVKTELEENCRVTAALLLSYELFPGVHRDGSVRTSNTVPDILDEAMVRIERMVKDVEGTEGPKGSTAAWYAAVLAKFSYLYQEYDSVTAAKYVQLAHRAWKQVEQETDILSPERFFAAAELYRATGRPSYHGVIRELGAALEPEQEREALLYGRITYLATEANVNLELCNQFLEYFMDEAEGIVKEVQNTPFPIPNHMEGEELESVLEHMMIVSVVDYVNKNKEYAAVGESYQHGLTGKVPGGICYISAAKESAVAEADIWENSVYTAKYILMLSEVLNHEP